MKYRYAITSDGKIEGLWSDILTGLGKAEVQRASDVEFQTEMQKWVVALRNAGDGPGCLLERFFRRTQAVQAEIEFHNEQLSGRY